MMLRLSLSVALACIIGAVSGDKNVRTTPDQGALVVDASGAHPNSYPNISAAVAQLQNRTEAQKIFIFPGTYTEQVYIPKLKAPLTIQGYTTNATTYKKNRVLLRYNLSRKTPGRSNNDATSTLRLRASNVKVYNLDISNTFGKGAQALALSAQNTNQGYYGCNFTGYQDTIYANVGRQIYAKSYVNGAVDFMFGLQSTVLFNEMDIETIGEGFITANGRSTPDSKGIFVFNKAHVTGTSGPNSTDLGRPWRPFSKVIFQYSYLGDVVRPRGWSKWGDVQSPANVTYLEYQNYGPGANRSQRVSWSSEATAPVKASDMFGGNFTKESWVDIDYL